MRKLIVLLPIVLLTGCFGSVPVKRTFPEAPQEFKVACPDLQLVEPTTKLSEVVSTVTKNYGQYHECKAKVDAWTEWYESQKKIFESVK